MKRLHLHISVPDLAPAVAFYSTLFDAAPAGVRWETFVTHGEAVSYGEDEVLPEPVAACCGPVATTQATAAKSACG